MSSDKPKPDRQRLSAPTSADYVFERFLTTPQNAKRMLEQQGVAIVDLGFSETELEAIRTGFWDFVENATADFEVPIKRDQEDTWRSFYDLWPTHGMLIQQWGIGHAQFIWNVRQNPKVASVFATIWNVPVDELLVSFDGASFGFPHEVTNRGMFRNNLWFHVDQRYSDSSFQCVQGWVTADEVRPLDATLAVVPGSHLFHEAFAKVHKKQDHKKDWYKLTGTELKWYMQYGKRVCIKCPPGHLVLWDSRTLHAGQEAVKGRPQRNFRRVVYTCYTPRSKATAHNLKRKRQALENLRTTSHWPHAPKLFPKKPRTYGKEIKPIREVSKAPILSDLGKRLAGK